MEPSRILSRALNTLFPFRDFLYILQQEEYGSRRFLSWLPKFFFRRNIEKRQRLVQTPRILLTGGLSILFFVGIFSTLFVVTTPTMLHVGLSIIVLLLIPFLVLTANVIVAPLVFLAGEVVISKARRKIAESRNLKVVTIAGSHGKTTTRTFVFQLVRLAHKTQTLPGNINTPLGIATWVNANLEEQTEVLIAEVDGYWPGEIARSCSIVRPDIAVLVSVGTQHLVRFKDRAQLEHSLFEVFDAVKPGGSCVYPAELHSKIEKQYDAYLLPVETTEKIPGCESLSEAQQYDLALALKIADILDVPQRIKEAACTSLEIPDRRQKRTMMNGYDCIDDSYNISFESARAGLTAAKAAAQDARKKLLVVTAGIPELGKSEREKNKELGAVIAADAAHTIVLNSDFANEIEDGIRNKDSVMRVSDLTSFWETASPRFPSSEWFLLIQPELTDLYY